MDFQLCEDVTVDLRVKEDGVYSLRDIFNDDESTLTSENNNLHINTSIGPKQVQVIQLHK